MVVLQGRRAAAGVSGEMTSGKWLDNACGAGGSLIFCEGTGVFYFWVVAIFWVSSRTRINDVEEIEHFVVSNFWRRREELSSKCKYDMYSSLLASIEEAPIGCVVAECCLCRDLEGGQPRGCRQVSSTHWQQCGQAVSRSTSSNTSLTFGDFSRQLHLFHAGEYLRKLTLPPRR